MYLTISYISLSLGQDHVLSKESCCAGPRLGPSWALAATSLLRLSASTWPKPRFMQGICMYLAVTKGCSP